MDRAQQVVNAVAARFSAAIDAKYATRKEAADAMQISEPRLSRLCTGHKSVYGALYKAAADLERGGHDPFCLVNGENDATPEAIEVAQRIDRMRPEVRAVALSILSDLGNLDDVIPVGRDRADLEALRNAHPVARRSAILGLLAYNDDED